MKELRSKFLGSIVGAALGDAMGASREGRGIAAEQDIEHIAVMEHPLRYTDDTHMTIGVTESLVESRGFHGDHMAGRFADNYFKEPWRGYGLGPPRVFRLLRNGEGWDKAANHIYPGGSFGNGAAMRVAPVGLLFWDDPEKLRVVAYQTSLITHSHVLGKEGAALQARSVALGVAENPDERLDAQSFISRLLDFTTEDVYRAKLTKFAALLEHPDDRRGVVRELGFSGVPLAVR